MLLFLTEASRRSSSQHNQNKITEWANRLPLIDTFSSNNNINIMGTLVHYDSDHIRIMLDDLVLSIDKDDIVDICEITSPEDDDISCGIPVKLTLRVNSRLKGIIPSSFYKETIFKSEKPFALSCRPQYQIVPPPIPYRKLEREFLELNHIRKRHYDSYSI